MTRSPLAARCLVLALAALLSGGATAPVPPVDDPTELIDDAAFGAGPRPAVMPAGEWALTAQVDVMTMIDGSLKDRMQMAILAALAATPKTTRICVGPRGEGADALFVTAVAAARCDGGEMVIADGGIRVRRSCDAKGATAKVGVDGRYSDRLLISMTQVQTPIASGKTLLVQSSATGRRVGPCDRSNFALDQIDRKLDD